MMNNAPQYSLRWNNYVSHVTDAFNLLRFENDLVDVTLCCEGGKIKAHKMLLSACSSYFKQIFKENPCQHPVIIFKNVKYEDLNAIINFMYHGEVNIFQEQLESFLITAELLEVKGLTDNTSEEENAASQIIDGISLDLTSKPKTANETVTTPSDEPINLATIQTTRDESYIPETNNYKPYVEDETEDIEQSSVSNPVKIDLLSSSGNSKSNVAPPTEEMQVDNQSSNAEDLSEKNTSGMFTLLLLVISLHLCTWILHLSLQVIRMYVHNKVLIFLFQNQTWC